MRTRKLRTQILISFFSVISIFALSIAILGFYVIKNDIIERAQSKVKNDLNSAREIYNEESENLKDVVRFTALRFFIKNAIRDSDIETIRSELEKIRKRESLDILTLTDENGQVIVRMRNSSVNGDNQSQDELVSRVLSDGEIVAGTVIVPSEELIKEGAGLAEQAYIKFIPTPKAKPSLETEQTSGMMIKAAAPVFGYEGSLIGVLYGGILLNRNYKVVDRIKETVYEEVKYKGKDIGTATIFQGDLRVSTNVKAEDGSRAIGTRVSEEVYEQVLIKGLPWIDRAFVVTDWYKTAYEPIKDVSGRVVGILYVGTLEKPFVDMAKSIFLFFLVIVFVSTLLASVFALILAGVVSRPLTHMLNATTKLSEGNLGYKVNIETGTMELNMLAASFNNMSSRLDERERSLKISNEKLAVLNNTYIDLVSFVSHELKGILGSTIVNAYSVRDGFFGVLNSRQRKALDSVTKNLDRLAGTVKKFLNLSRIEKGELGLNRTEVCLREDVFNTSLETFARKIVEKQMEIINNIQPQLKVNCDIDLLLIVANNLVDNAINYGFEKGKVILNSKDLGERVQIEVYNDSRPIREEEKARLFRRFSRLDVHEQKRIKGTGLGLFVAKEIIAKHDGDIWVEPKENGNSFIFQIEKAL
jgi:two-component system NtrC family sensor kinase